MTSTRLNGMIRLFRPELPIAAGICVLAGQVLAAGRLPPAATAILGFLCGFALSGAALILNDLFDYEVDCINAPDRPLPSGAVSRADVIALTAATSLVGLAAGLALGSTAFWISLVFWGIGILYNWRGKQTGLPGNLMVCASVGVTFILGAVTVGTPWSGIVWTFSGMAFCIDLGEEIAGDAMDMQGDKARGSRSIALLRGKRFALRLTVALWGLAVLLSLLPVGFRWLGPVYWAGIAITDVVLGVFSVRLVQSQTAESGRKAMRGAYLGSTLGVVAFLIGRLIG